MRGLVTPILMALALTASVDAQTEPCVQPSNQQLVIYRAGSLNRPFQKLIADFTCQTGISVKDVPMGSVDAARKITAGGAACDLYASADYSNIDLMLKPAGYADFTIVFARGKMVLAYSESGIAAKKLPAVVEPGSPEFHPPTSIPRASAKWYEILLLPGVAVGAGQPFLDPGAYRTNMIFQLAQEHYSVPNLYNDLLGHLTIAGPDRSANALGKRFDFQFTYEHNARAAASANPDYRYVDLPDEINLSDPSRNAYYGQHALVALPGLGTPQSARTIAVPATRVAWGITLLTNAPNRDNAVKFLQLLLGPAGASALGESGPTPIAPALVAPADLPKLPEVLRSLVTTVEK